MAGIPKLRALARALPYSPTCTPDQRPPCSAVGRWRWTVFGAYAGGRPFALRGCSRLKLFHAHGSRPPHSQVRCASPPAYLPASRRCTRVEPHRKVRPDRFSLLPRLLFPLPIGATLRSRPSPCSSGGAMGYLGVRHSPECFCGISRARNHRLALSRLRSGYWASRAHAAGLRDLFTPPWPHPELRAPLPRRPLVFPGLVGARPFHRDET